MSTFLMFIMMAMAVIGTTALAPDLPSNVEVSARSATEILVTFEPPSSDGGSEVTSYSIEWDTKPPVDEVQVITTSTDTGPNEVQTVTTSATHVDEVQVIRTVGDDVDEVQTVRTTTSLGETLAGYFSLVYDTSASGGSVEYSAAIPFDCIADPSDPTGQAGPDGPAPRTTFKEIIEAMPNVGTVDVTRSGPDSVNGYIWTITFTENSGDVPQIALHTSALTTTFIDSGLPGTGADVIVDTPRDGNQIKGNFRVEYDGHTTGLLDNDATDVALKDALETLPSIDTVNVIRGTVDDEGGFAWTVTFSSHANKGNLTSMTIDDSWLEATGGGCGKCGVHAVVCTGGSEVAPCMGNSVEGNDLDGTFTLTFAICKGGNDDGDACASDGDCTGGGTCSSETTDPMPFDVTPSVMTTRLEALGDIEAVQVTRSEPDTERGYTWSISFTGMGNIGNVPEMTADDAELVATGKSIVMNTPRPGTVQ